VNELNVLTEKFREVVFAVLPITIIVLILNFTITPMETDLFIRFIIGVIFIVIGLTIFLLGVDIGITPIGNHMGSKIAKTNKLLIVVLAGLILGFLVSVAEPDLHILANQVDEVSLGQISKLSILIVVSLGIALLLSLGLVRILYNIPLFKILTVLYGIILILSFFVSGEYLAISFDASGATTGALTVPFILSLSMGVSKIKKDSKASEKDSFGLVAIASSGAIIAVMLMSILSGNGDVSGSLDSTSQNSSILELYIHELIKIIPEILLALSPILIIFVILQKTVLKIHKREYYRILVGAVYTFIGLVLFLVGVNAGFMEVGAFIGEKLGSFDNKAFVIITAFILGFVTILAEPAVYVLTNQIEEVTSGYVKRRLVMMTLSIGVGAAIALSVIRIMTPALSLWHFLLPGYLIAVILAYIVPKLFVGIAFDSGGVSSGPMTATFILSFAQGVANSTEGADVLLDGFGVIAMVAMTPLIALQILGLIFKIKSAKGGKDND